MNAGRSPHPSPPHSRSGPRFNAWGLLTSNEVPGLSGTGRPFAHVPALLTSLSRLAPSLRCPAQAAPGPPAQITLFLALPILIQTTGPMAYETLNLQW
jgi:hypothetical protein